MRAVTAPAGYKVVTIKDGQSGLGRCTGGKMGALGNKGALWKEEGKGDRRRMDAVRQPGAQLSPPLRKEAEI
jgi:hypothetical protein